MNFSQFAEEVLLDSLKDFGKLLPFLFVTYLLMELLEHKAGDGMQNTIRRAGRFGPLVGGLLGMLPQCGFSAVASGFYAGRVITLGTLIAVYLSTSDEMLPIMIAEGAAPTLIIKILLLKFLIGMTAGFIIDFMAMLLHRNEHDHSVHDMCHQEGCHCERGIWRSALYHTLHIGLFLLLVMLCLNTVIFFLGHERLASIFSSLPVVGHLLSALVGLIPNCAASILITKLYLEGVLSAGCMLSGLLVGSGIGLLMLFRVNGNKKQALLVLLLLFTIGAVTGMVADLLGMGTIL